jgi:ferredoxin like protein
MSESHNDDNSKLKSTIEDKLFLDKYKLDKQSHIEVDQEKYKTDLLKAVNYICPAKVYAHSDEKNECLVSFENCLECGTCRVAAPDYVKWYYPRGGFGVQYRLG